MKSQAQSDGGRKQAALASTYTVVPRGQLAERNPMGRMDVQSRKPNGNDAKGSSSAVRQGAN